MASKQEKHISEVDTQPHDNSLLVLELQEVKEGQEVNLQHKTERKQTTIFFFPHN